MYVTAEKWRVRYFRESALSRLAHSAYPECYIVFFFTFDVMSTLEAIANTKLFFFQSNLQFCVNVNKLRFSSATPLHPEKIFI